MPTPYRSTSPQSVMAACPAALDGSSRAAAIKHPTIVTPRESIDRPFPVLGSRTRSGSKDEPSLPEEALVELGARRN